VVFFTLFSPFLEKVNITKVSLFEKTNKFYFGRFLRVVINFCSFGHFLILALMEMLKLSLPFYVPQCHFFKVLISYFQSLLGQFDCLTSEMLQPTPLKKNLDPRFENYRSCGNVVPLGSGRKPGKFLWR